MLSVDTKLQTKNGVKYIYNKIFKIIIIIIIIMKNEKERREVRLAGCGRTLPGTSLTCQTRIFRIWQGSGIAPLMPRDKAMESAPSRAQKSGGIKLGLFAAAVERGRKQAERRYGRELGSLPVGDDLRKEEKGGIFREKGKVPPA
ncbi:Uncharacterized protein TCM_043451 [Theobroma cacao]|uniref:Uncharacterized protein n=1 Tax=Theobroma cacao TaxID=3641 RepID=A0A061FPU2_THECC|nr:Uncharacterized protein TCM_043451 [Theobroma cacao]